jgi:hypothetical protein
LADAGVFSLSGFKILNFIWGGFIAAKDAALFEAVGKEVASWPRLRPRHYRRMGLEVVRYSLLTSPLVFPLAFAVRSRLVQKGEIANIIPRALIETRSIDEMILSRPSVSALAESQIRPGRADKARTVGRSRQSTTRPSETSASRRRAMPRCVTRRPSGTTRSSWR